MEATIVHMLGELGKVRDTQHQLQTSLRDLAEVMERLAVSTVQSGSSLQQSQTDTQRLLMQQLRFLQAIARQAQFQPKKKKSFWSGLLEGLVMTSEKAPLKWVLGLGITLYMLFSGADQQSIMSVVSKLF